MSPRLVCSALALCALTAVGCAHDKLDRSYGLTYATLFAAQVAPHPGRDLAPLRGDDGRRIMQNYMHSLGGDEKQGAGASGAPNAPSMTLPGMGSQQQQQNPFAMKAR